MKTRRQEPPGRGGGDSTKPGRKAGPAKPYKPSKYAKPADSGRPAKPTGPGKPAGPAKSGKPGKGAPPKRSERAPTGERRSPADGPGRATRLVAGQRDAAPRTGRGGPRQRGPAPVVVPVLARTGRELLYGRNAVLEALAGRRSLERLFVAEGVREDERLRAILSLAANKGVEVERVPRLMLDDATRGANHQGVAMEAEPFRYATLETIVETPGTVLVLDHLQDPQNVGSLLRAAEAAQVAGVVIPHNRAVEVTPSVVNASAGAVEHLQVAIVPNLSQALEALKGSGRWVVGLDGGPNSSDIYATTIPTPAALVVGSEGSGLGSLLRKQCDLLLALPMRGKVASLNAATAGSIALYELLRREQTEAGDALG